MEKIALVLFLLLSLCTPVYAVNFVEISRYEDCIVDVDSIEGHTSDNHEYVVVWLRMIPGEDMVRELFNEYGETVDHTMIFVAFHENRRLMQVLHANLYDKKGNIIDNYSHPFKMSECEEVTSGSLAESLYEYVWYNY